MWNRYPVFRVFLALSAGILLANFVPTPFYPFLLSLILCGILVAVTAFSPRLFKSFAHRWWFGLSIGLLFLCLGVIISHLYSNRHSPLHLKSPPEKAQHLLVQLEEDPLEKENSFGMKASLLGRIDSGLVRNNTQLMLYLQKNEAARQLRYGDRLALKLQLNQLQPPQNPFEFDYKDYLNLKAIYYQAYADSTSWSKLSSGHGYWVFAKAREIRRTMLGLIDRWELTAGDKAITKALLLGYRYDIEDDQLKSYASAGAMHVLAVSGLHVGIVYLMGSYLLIFLVKIPRGTMLRSIILILLLWFYACLTGLSASVVRAATMFTFVAIGSGFKRTTSVYNTILGSALLLLLIKPTYLFEVGFQLSYAAVFGIVWLQPRLESLWQPPNWVTKQIWAITTVSIAAQLVTFPLGLYYFHQFPTLFLLSNLLVIPIVTILMYIGLIALIISAMGYIPGFLVSIYDSFLSLMNGGVNWVEQQSVFLLQFIHISRLELVLLYFIIVTFCTWCFAGGYRRLLLATLATLALCLSQVAEQRQLSQSREIVVYSVRNHTAIGFYSDNENVFLSDSTFLQDDDALTFHIKHHWWARDVAEPQKHLLNENLNLSHLHKKDCFLSFCNQSLWLVHENAGFCPDASLWVVENGSRIPDQDFETPRELVLTTNLGYRQRLDWLSWAKENNIGTWDSQEKGAFSLELGD